MLEPLSYSLNDKNLSSEEKRYAVVESAKRLTPLGADILKAEFPLDIAETNQTLWKEACEEISAAVDVPWILLSAAVEYETFVQQVVVACNAGASGIAVGRAVWKEAVTMMGNGRIQFLEGTAKQRITRLTSLCIALARPFTDFFQADAPFDWHKTY
jgi:tagatose-1,6-bisphosphate aldolase